MSVNGSNTDAEELTAILACLDIAVLTVDRFLRVSFTNPAARKLIQRGDGLRLTGDRLHASNAGDTSLLAAALGGLPDGAAGSGRPNQVVTVSGSEAGPAYRVVVVPLPPNGTLAGPAAQAALFVDTVQEPDAETEARILQNDFQLTRAEARLAVHLMSGASLTQAAEKFRVSHNTVRSQLRTVFEKTQVRRQADLVRVLRNHRALRRLLV